MEPQRIDSLFKECEIIYVQQIDQPSTETSSSHPRRKQLSN